ncbi:hypothetical protein [Magnetococcus sp. PR-3]|uniref:hypothetical protein n=1 Tax=Magnetococcus sp. PR-3 TaxID=3120355 RepID=UPI002FCE13FC
MPTTELIGQGQLSKLTGKQFTVQDLGAGKVKLTPLDATDPIILKGKVMLNGAEFQGLPPGANPIVEIEGAGTATTMAGGKSTTLKSFEANGTLMEGTNNGVTLTGGEAKITTAPKAVAKAATPKAAGLAKAQTVAMTKPAATTTGTAATTKVATGAAAATQAATGGSIWTGSGWGLGLGLGLGVWGTIALGGVVTAAVGIGVYNYMKRDKAEDEADLETGPEEAEASAAQEEAQPNPA